MTTETPREIAHTAIIDILRKHKVMDSAIVAAIMPVLDEFAKSRYEEGLTYSVTLIRAIKHGLSNMVDTAESIIKNLTDKGAK